MYKTKKERYELLRAQLVNERSTFDSHWRDLSDYILPRRQRFTITDINKGDRRNHKIIDSTATLAARTLRAGMMSGVTSPARPWFRLTTSDPVLSEVGAVKQWLHGVTQAMTTIFIRSNLYNVLPMVYGDIGTLGTSSMFVDEDPDTVIRCYSFPVGSYYIANDEKLNVRVFMRDFRMTVRQLVEKFGEKDHKGNINWYNFSSHVQSMYEKGQLETWIDVCHVVSPNHEYYPGALPSKFKKYRGCYFERSQEANTYLAGDGDKFLREEGYDYFPVLVPRWEVTGEDVYGTECPGMQVLGDIKALQVMQKRKAQAVEKMVNPPMTGPTSLRSQRSSILPGDITYVDSRDQQSGFRPAHEVNPRIQELLMDIQDHQNRIRRGMFEDLFLMLSNLDRKQITAREIEERHEEKLLALGPVLEQLNQDLLDPLIDITFDLMLKQQLVPPPPEQLQGRPLKVEYISIMAQSQKLIGVGNVERFMGFAGQLASFQPDVLDKINADQAIDVYADITSIQPGIVRTDEEVAKIREDRAAAQAQQQRMANIQQSAMAAKDMSQAKMGQDDNMLNKVATGEIDLEAMA